jgi:hypothetical protein
MAGRVEHPGLREAAIAAVSNLDIFFIFYMLKVLIG